MTNGHRQPCVSGATSQGGNETRFPPIAGPFSSPHTGVLPTAWQSFESDLNSPDISSWLPHQISNYFVQHGFGNDVCKVFIEQVWNKSPKNSFYYKSLFCVFLKLCEEGLTSNTVISKTVISNFENGYLEFNLKSRF